jgi:hypothetical protein
VGATQNLDPQIFVRMKNYKGISKLRKEAMMVLVRMLDQNNIEELQ